MQTEALTKKLYRSLALIVLLICTGMVQADGLFDFQMKLAKIGNAEAQLKIGEMYETGFGVKKDLKQSRKWIMKAAAQGHESANFKLLYWNIEKSGLKGKSKQKLNELRLKAEEENAQATYYLGKMYANGVGVKRNYDKALEWLNKAAYLGVARAETDVARIRENKQKSQRANNRAGDDAKRKLQQEQKLKVEAAKKKADAAKRSKYLKQNEKKKAEEISKKQEWQKRKAEKEESGKSKSGACSGRSARFLSTCR